MYEWESFEVSGLSELKEYEPWFGEARIREIASKADELVRQGYLVSVRLQVADVPGMDCDGPFTDRQYRLEGIMRTTPETLAAMIEHGVDGLPAYGWSKTNAEGIFA